MKPPLPYSSNSDISDVSYQISCEPVQNFDELKQQWLALEEAADCHFFLSWVWVENWLQTYTPDCDVLRIYSGEYLLGMALMVKCRQRRHGILRSQALFLHQTGLAEQDQIWIEYNGFLLCRGHENAVTAAAIGYLHNCYSDWDELIVGAVTEKVADTMAATTDLLRHDIWQAGSYGVDLNAIRTSGNDYLASLSRNTRYQINRSIRLYEQQGEISLTRAKDTEQALSFMQEAGRLHKLRWGEQPEQSGFANPAFVDFHNNLIRRMSTADYLLDDTTIDIFHFDAEGCDVYLYFFLYRKTAYFYLSGICGSDDARLKPGLVAHALCIKYYLEQGVEYYDFMGGDDRYKASLGEKRQQLYKLSLQKKQFKFTLENMARKMKGMLRKTSHEAVKPL